MHKKLPIRKILALCGSMLTHLSLGNGYTIGNMIPYITSYLRLFGPNPNITVNDAIWLQTMLVVAQGIFTNVGGILSYYLGPRTTAYIGCFVASSGIALSYFTINHSLPLLVITYSFMYGAGVGLAYTSPITTCMAWFPNHRALVTGLIVGCLGFSGVVFSPVQTEYLNPNNTVPNKDGFFTDPYLITRVPNLFLLLGGTFSSIQLIGCSMLTLPSDESKEITTDYSSTENVIEATIVTSVQDTVESYTVKQVFYHCLFYILWITFFLNSQIVNFVTPMYKAYGQTFIKDDKFLAMLGAMLAFCNAFGRILWGIIMNKLNYKKCMLLLTSGCVILISTISLTVYGGKVMYAVWVSAIFLIISGNFSIFPTFAAQSFGLKYAGVIYGLLFSNAIISTPLTAIITQNFATKFGWNGLFGLIAGCSGLSFLITLIFKF